MNEVEVFIDYCNDSDEIFVLGGSNPLIIEEFFVKAQSKIVPFEKPDFYMEFSNKVLLVEHFSFDSSKRKKKVGSLLKLEEAQKDKQFNEFVNNEYSKGKINVEHMTTYETAITFDDYEKNLVDSLVKHSNVQSYLENFKSITESEKKLEFALCIENTSILPDTVYKKNQNFIVLPVNSKMFLEKLRSYEGVNHVFLLQRGNRGKKNIYYLQNKPNQIDKLLAGTLIDGSYKFVNWKPQSFAFSRIIPKN